MKKADLLVDKKEVTEFKVLHETGNVSSIEKLIKLYNEDKYKARVLYFNDTSKFNKERLCYFEYSDGSYRLVDFRVKCGISITNKMYFTEKSNNVIGYNNKTKFYCYNNGFFKPLTFNALRFSSDFDIKYNALLKRHSWIRMLKENPWTQHITFNNIIKHKLYSIDKLKKYYFKVPVPVVNILLESKLVKDYYGNKVKYCLDIIKQLENITSLRLDMLNNRYFTDMLTMSKTLGRKINCKWGDNRISSEHDEWSKEITNILMSSEEEIQLTLNKKFIDFSEFSGFKLLKTNKEVICEGLLRKHCVATYINKINKGVSGIYSINGFTLELSDYNALTNSQFKGYRNCSPPEDLVKLVNEKINEFNELNRFEYKKEVEQSLDWW